jgi:hypothetical protein
MIYGFTGPMDSGKTTAARMITNNILSFATPLKKAVKEIFHLTDAQLHTFEGKQLLDIRWGMSPRDMLQYVGTDLLRGWIPKLWVTNMRIRLNEIKDSGVVVAIDDVRFEDEAELIRNLGGTIIHMQRPDARTAGIHGHDSEKGIDIQFGDVRIINDTSLADLLRDIGHLRNYYEND